MLIFSRNLALPCFFLKSSFLKSASISLSRMSTTCSLSAIQDLSIGYIWNENLDMFQIHLPERKWRMLRALRRSAVSFSINYLVYYFSSLNTWLTSTIIVLSTTKARSKTGLKRNQNGTKFASKFFGVKVYIFSRFYKNTPFKNWRF